MSSSTDVLRPRLPELQTLEATHDTARAQGYAVGWAQGRRDAEAAARAESAERASSSDSAAHELLAAACVRVDEQAGALALELTRALVGATLDAAGSDPAHVLDRVAGLLPGHAVASVRLHPSVAAVAGDLTGLGVQVLADPTLGPADAVAQADDHVVDLRVDEALARLAKVLG